MTNILELKNVETYYGPVMAIRGVSMIVPEGHIVSLLGANGAGKTTVLKTISGAMEPLKGSVTYKGFEIRGQDPDAIARAGIARARIARAEPAALLLPAQRVQIADKSMVSSYETHRKNAWFCIRDRWDPVRCMVRNNSSIF